jgi:hypothetical protein
MMPNQAMHPTAINVVNEANVTCADRVNSSVELSRFAGLIGCVEFLLSGETNLLLFPTQNLALGTARLLD